MTELIKYLSTLDRFEFETYKVDNNLLSFSLVVPNYYLTGEFLLETENPFHIYSNSKDLYLTETEFINHLKLQANDRTRQSH